MWEFNGLEIKIIQVGLKVGQQKLWICFFQSKQLFFHLLHVSRRIAFLVRKLMDVFRHQGAIRVKEECLRLRIKAKWVELTAQRLVITQSTSIKTQMRTLSVKTNLAKRFFFALT